MIDPNELYQEVMDEANPVENGLLSVKLYNRLGAAAEDKLLKELIEELQTEGLRESRKGLIHDLLFPFTRILELPAKNGIFTKPIDYEFFGSMRAAYDNGTAGIELMHLSSLLCEAETDPTISKMDIEMQIEDLRNGDQWIPVENMAPERATRRLGSWIKNKRPSAAKPICEQINNGFQVYPKSTMSAVLLYYRSPKHGKMVTTVDPNTGELVYDQANSIPWEWSKGAKDMLKSEILIKYYKFVRDPESFRMNQASNIPAYKAASA